MVEQIYLSVINNYCNKKNVFLALKDNERNIPFISDIAEKLFVFAPLRKEKAESFRASKGCDNIEIVDKPVDCEVVITNDYSFELSKKTNCKTVLFVLENADKDTVSNLNEISKNKNTALFYKQGKGHLDCLAKKTGEIELNDSGLFIVSEEKIDFNASVCVPNDEINSLNNETVFNNLLMRESELDNLKQELDKYSGTKYLLKALLKKIIKVCAALMAKFLPTRLLLRFLVALKNEGIKTALLRIKGYFSMKEVRENGRNFFFDENVEYVDTDSCYQDNIDFSGEKTDVKMLAYYLPQYHTFPENDEWWGKGFTEWTNTRAASPRFFGHYQPRTPHKDIGYYDLSDISTMEKQIKLAKQHGIYGFCFYYYWFSGKRLMEKPVDMLLEHPELDFPFCLCWANENWTRAWDGQNRDVLVAQNYSDEDDNVFIRDLKKYIDDKRYIRINGKPLIVVYNPGQIPNCEKTFARWREVAAELGLGEILIWTCRTANNTAPSLGIENCIDAEVEFPPHNTWLEEFAIRDINLHGKSASLLNYQKLVSGWTQLYKKGLDKKEGEKPIHRACMMAWDNAARRKDNWFTYHHFSLKSLYDWVQLICTQARRDFEEEDRFVFVNAWNEWAEGTYLEPDEKYGYANINTVSKALFNIPFVDDTEVLSESSLKLEETNKKIAVQIHLFYLETMAEIIENLNYIPYNFDVFITTDTEEKRLEINKEFSEKCKCDKVTVDVVMNQGRDVAPFILQMKNYIDEYDYICHIHSKRTVTSGYGNDWRKYIFKHLFGSSDYLKRMFYMLENDSKLGLVFPETFPPLEYQAIWGGNLHGVRKLLEQMGIFKDYPQNAVFPVGNMFWAKTEAVRALFDLNWKIEDFPKEQGQVNATVAHAIERSWVYLAEEYGFSYKKVFNNIVSTESTEKKRIALYAHFNKHGEFSERDNRSLQKYRKFFDKIIFVSNSELSEEEKNKIKASVDEIHERKNEGFDFGMWKFALQTVGHEELCKYDEVVILNNSTVGPYFDLSEIFSKMEAKQVDFWGLTLFPYQKGGKYIGKRNILEHIQSYFVVFNNRMVKNGDLEKFFFGIETTNSFIETVGKCEVGMTNYFASKGYTYDVYIGETRYMGKYLLTPSLPYDKPATLLLLGCPLVKKKAINYMIPHERMKLNYILQKLGFINEKF